MAKYKEVRYYEAVARNLDAVIADPTLRRKYQGKGLSTIKHKLGIRKNDNSFDKDKRFLCIIYQKYE